ncbi:hypothetical protein FQA39_LY17305 [Lamprigera yunnana]|nr:hypothetical protein FQA39_LY17305 [Lamprigera yunnana]
MYSIYEAEFWPIATDAYSAVERMRRQFTALAFEADHETIYGLGRWHSEVYLQYLENKCNLHSDRDFLESSDIATNYQIISIESTSKLNVTCLKMKYN